MQRYYYVRDRRIEVDEVEGVAAVQIGRDERGEARAAASSFGRSAVTALRESGAALPDDTLAAFESAGWAFVRPNAATREAFETARAPENAEAVGKVIVRRDGSPAIATQLLNVQVDPQLDAPEAEAVLAERGLEILSRLGFAPNLYETRATGWSDALAASVDLHDDPRFVFAEPSLIEHIPGRATPTDPDLGEQWQWSNDGSNGGTAGADVSVEAAWDHTFGAGVRVAIIDNGFDDDHEDLHAGVSAVSGFFQSGTPATFVQGTAGMPDSNHGTFCAGMVGARRNNGNGGVGAAPDCELILIACLGDQVGTQTTLARAVAYAIDLTNEVGGANAANGPDILVSSLGPNGAVWDLTATLQLALDAAPTGRQGQGLPIFWAASNGNNVDVTQDEVVSHPNVIAVVRSTRNDLEDNAARGASVELIAPGVDVYSTQSGDNYGTSTGTSFAAPCAAGCAALALSVNTALTGAELRQVMRDSADKIGGVVYDANGHNDDYGFGRVNANRAVRLAAQRVTLLTPSVLFNDIPEGELTARSVSWQCFGFDDLTFEVVSGPTGPFDLLLGSSVTLPAPGVGAGAKAQLWLSFTGTTAGATVSGSVTVRLVETGEQWVVPISANTIARPTVAVALVLDRSGSMTGDAGDGRQRVEVLRDSAQIFIDVAKPDTGIGIARFDHDAQPVMSVIDAGPEIFGPGRVQATAAIAAHVPNLLGTTSIGDGVEAGAGLLDTVAGGYDATAMIVLTDGQENAPQFISDVAGQVDDTVFAIGLGAPAVINPAKLTELTDSTGGYVAVTGILSSDEHFTLAKYYLQILAGVSNEEIVLDPDGHLKPTGRLEVPFNLTRADSGADVVLLSPAPDVMEFELVTPSGAVIKPGALPPGVRFITGKQVAYYRFQLPVVEPGGGAVGSGRWVVRLHCERGRFAEYLEKLKESDPEGFEHAAAHGLRFAMEIHARTAIRMAAAVRQKGIDVGDVMHLSVRLSEAGLPVEKRAEVVAELEGPGGPQTVKLQETGPGAFTAQVPGDRPGLYRYRIVATGKSLRGERFTRERRLTGAIYVPKPPQQEGEPDRPGGDCAKRLAALLEVIDENAIVARPLAELLRRKGHALPDVFACLKAAIREDERASAPAGRTTAPTWADIIDALDSGPAHREAKARHDILVG